MIVSVPVVVTAIVFAVGHVTLGIKNTVLKKQTVTKGEIELSSTA